MKSYAYILSFLSFIFRHYLLTSLLHYHIYMYDVYISYIIVCVCPYDVYIYLYISICISIYISPVLDRAHSGFGEEAED